MSENQYQPPVAPPGTQPSAQPKFMKSIRAWVGIFLYAVAMVAALAVIPLVERLLNPPFSDMSPEWHDTGWMMVAGAVAASFASAFVGYLLRHADDYK